MIDLKKTYINNLLFDDNFENDIKTNDEKNDKYIDEKFKLNEELLNNIDIKTFSFDGHKTYCKIN